MRLKRQGKEHANDCENWLELSTGLEWISKISIIIHKNHTIIDNTMNTAFF